MCDHGLNVGVIARGTAGGREPVVLFLAIDLVVHLLLKSRNEHLRLAEALELGGYAPRIHVVGGEQLRALIVLLAPLATASRRGVGVRRCTER